MSKGSLQVIRWVNPSPDDIVWRYPNDDIQLGSVVIVEEHQVAVFFRDGKAYDVLGPGRHVLSTLNIPLLSKAYNIIYPETPFKATVIFISMKQFQGKFGGQTQTQDLAPLKFYGSFWFRVSDPQLFVVEVVGGQRAFDTESVNKFLRGYFLENAMASLSKYKLAEVFSNVDKVTAELKLDLLEPFRRIGLELIDVKMEGLDTTPEYRDRIFWITQTGTPAEVLRMDTVKSVAQELGKSPGASIGTGMVIIPPLLSTPTPAQAPAAPAAQAQPPSFQGMQCPKCGTLNPPGARFCYNCGTPLTKKCPKCGNDVPLNARFCPYCGYQFT
ncbi:SPFH domain-containing protein [Infirmifilum sp. NZ]|uniref:SPFH domain-containing protein n=1 Tax=Infirmifilum sp. NZ TaxID=2926850 RepID=UPI002797F88A|nr:SPFH domain-containing protein [Infirmifilum sp. NZ]UNQ74058.1 SPFH domain-containing protein [Infirmifilum sp. NZ]